jgi:hypothetical protein
LTTDDPNKLANRNSTDAKRREAIMNFLNYNPGCTKEDVIRGVKEVCSKNTVQKVIDNLQEEEQIQIAKDKLNSRGYKLFLCNDNIQVVLNQQIKDFNYEFTKLLEKIESVIPELILLPFTSKENIDKNFMQILYYEQLPHFILKYLMQCLLLKSLVVWPKNIQKEKIRHHVTSMVFSEMSKIISNYSNFYNKKLSENDIQIHYNSNIFEEIKKSETDILYFELFLRLCENKGIGKEFENVVDKLWLLNSDVQKYLHTEARQYNLSYEYEKDDWRKYLKLYRQNIVRIEEIEKDKKQKIKDLISNLDGRGDFFQQTF